MAKLAFKDEKKLRFFLYSMDSLGADGKHPIKIKRNCRLGQYIFAERQYCDFAPNQDYLKEFQFIIEIEFPDTPYSTAENKFVFFGRERLEDINSIIDSYMELDFWIYYRTGINLGHQQRDVFESYIISRGMQIGKDANEALKKKAYREHLKLLNRQLHGLYQKTNYVFQNVRREIDKEVSLLKIN